MTLDLKHLRAWIGHEEITSEEISEALVARFDATFDREGPLGAVPPRMLHWCLGTAKVATALLGPDGHPARGGFLPPVPLPRRMWAGGRLLFQGELRIGETLTRRSTIREVTAKEGRSGLLCFVKVEHVLQAGDRRVLIEDQDIVYRAADDREEPPPGSSPLPPPPAPAGQHRRVVTPSPALLFRYSALTFNGHRIHYDLPYARNVEGYPGLVVHGPLQATLLAHFAEAILGRPPSEFSFRSLSPLFDDADVTLNATENEAGIRLWTSRPNGPVAMEAQARW